MIDLAAARAALEDHEGLVQHLYLDTQKLPTVGVGCRVFGAQASLQLPWLRADGAMPLAAEIAHDYDRVAAMAPGMRPEAYLGPGALFLDKASVDQLLQVRLDHEFLPGLRETFPAFDDGYPGPAQLAIVDMAFNLGVRGLTGGFPHLCAAVRIGDWSAAAWNCHRKTCRESRNEWTRDQFLAARAAS